MQDDEERIVVRADFAAAARLQAVRVALGQNEFGETLDETGRVVIPGIYFDTDKATLRPASETALTALLAVLEERGVTRAAERLHSDDTRTSSCSGRSPATRTTSTTAR